MNSELNKSEDLENKITSSLAIIANESKSVLMAIDGILEAVKKSEEPKRAETLENSFKDFKKDFIDNFERIDKALNELPPTLPKKFQWAIAEIKDPINETLKLFNNHPSPAISTKWFEVLANKLKSVHSIAGRVFVLETFNEVVIKNRKPGWAIKRDEFLKGYLLFPEDRKKVIEEINSRDDINAYVDDQNDILYVIAGGYEKYRGVVLLFLTFLLGLALIYGNVISSIVSTKMPSGEEMSSKELMLFYILCWVGFTIHIIMKSTDARKENSCLNDIYLWIHIKETGFLTSAVAVIAGYLVLLGLGDQLTYTSAIASGFAVDSFGSRIIKHYYSELETAAKNLEEIKLEKETKA
jgi:hypothetical protein